MGLLLFCKEAVQFDVGKDFTFMCVHCDSPFVATGTPFAFNRLIAAVLRFALCDADSIFGAGALLAF